MRIRKFFALAGALLSIILTALIVAYFTFANPHRLKTQIIDQISAQTGLHLQIQGDIGWVFTPRLGISLAQVGLQQPVGFDKDATFTAARVTVFVAAKPLISGKVVIQKLVAHQFTLSFHNPLSKPAIPATIRGNLQFILPEQNITVDHLAIDSGTLHATGKISAQHVFRMLELKGQLTLPRMELMNGLGQLTDTVINFNYNPSQSVFGDIISSHWQANHINLKHITAKFFANAHTVKLIDINGDLAGGQAKGQMIITDFLDMPHYQVDTVLSHAEMRELLSSDILHGPVDLTAHLVTAGADYAALLTRLSGTLELTAYDGVLNRLDLLQQIRALHQFFQANPGVAASAGATRFTQLTASGVLAQGVLTSHDFLLQSPELQAAGKGTVNLVDGGVNYALSVKAQGNLAGAAYNVAVPLKVTGTLAKPKVKIALKAIKFSLQLTDDDASKQLAKAATDGVK